MRLVLDSNVYVSAFLSKGRGSAAFDLFHMIDDLSLNIYSSEFIFGEIIRVLGYERLKKAIGYSDADIAVYMEDLLSNNMIILVDDLPEIDVVRDKNDNPILATAIKSEADYLITRDKDLLSLNPYEDIKIIKPEEFLQILRNTNL